MSASMPELAAALGGAPPPPGPGGGMPGGPAMGGPVPPEPDDTDEGPNDTPSMDALDAAEEALHAFIQLDPDHADRAEATKAMQIVIKLKGNQQASAQAGDLSSLQRALGQGPGGTY